MIRHCRSATTVRLNMWAMFLHSTFTGTVVICPFHCKEYCCFRATHFHIWALVSFNICMKLLLARTVPFGGWRGSFSQAVLILALSPLPHLVNYTHQDRISHVPTSVEIPAAPVSQGIMGYLKEPKHFEAYWCKWIADFRCRFKFSTPLIITY